MITIDQLIPCEIHNRMRTHKLFAPLQISDLISLSAVLTATDQQQYLPGCGQQEILQQPAQTQLPFPQHLTHDTGTPAWLQLAPVNTQTAGPVVLQRQHTHSPPPVWVSPGSRQKRKQEVDLLSDTFHSVCL